MKKKIISLCLVVVLALTAIGGATLAYFTDESKQENTFAIGNIKIKVDEWGYVWDPVAKSYVEGATDAKTGGFEFSKLMPSYIVSKEPAVFNTGANDAYVRVAVTVNNLQAINDAIDNVYECKGGDHSDCKKIDGECYTDSDIQAIYDEVFAGWGINYTKTSYLGEYTGKEAQTVRGWMSKEHTFNTIIGAQTGTVYTKGGAKLIAIDYATKVGEGDSAYERYSPLNLFQSDDEIANNEAWEKGGNYSNGTFNAGDGRKTYYSDALDDDSRVYVFYFKIPVGADTGALFGGLNIPAEFNNAQMEMFKGLEIGIYADAIQTVGFADTAEGAKAAFEALEAEHPLGWWND